MLVPWHIVRHFQDSACPIARQNRLDSARAHVVSAWRTNGTTPCILLRVVRRRSRTADASIIWQLQQRRPRTNGLKKLVIELFCGFAVRQMRDNQSRWWGAIFEAFLLRGYRRSGFCRSGSRMGTGGGTPPGQHRAWTGPDAYRAEWISRDTAWRCWEEPTCRVQESVTADTGAWQKAGFGQAT